MSCPLPLDRTHHLGVSRASFFRNLELLPCPSGRGLGPYFPALAIALVVIRPGSGLPCQVILVAYLSIPSYRLPLALATPQARKAGPGGRRRGLRDILVCIKLICDIQMINVFFKRNFLGFCEDVVVLVRNLTWYVAHSSCSLK